MFPTQPSNGSKYKRISLSWPDKHCHTQRERNGAMHSDHYLCLTALRCYQDWFLPTALTSCLKCNPQSCTYLKLYKAVLESLLTTSQTGKQPEEKPKWIWLQQISVSRGDHLLLVSLVSAHLCNRFTHPPRGAISMKFYLNLLHF